MTDVDVLVSALGPGRLMPSVCARHGERPDTFLPIQPPGRTPFLLRLLMPFIVMLRGSPRPRAVVPDWPFCRRCRGRRRAVLAGCVALALVPLVGAFGVIALAGTESEVTGQVAVGGFLLGLCVATVVAASVSPAGLAGASVSDNGLHVVFRNPHPTFAAQLTGSRPRP